MIQTDLPSTGRKRSGGVSSSGGTGEAEQTLNQLLVEMDGIASKEGVVMLASTNRGDVLDKVENDVTCIYCKKL